VEPDDITIRAAAPADFAAVADMHYPVWRQSWNGILSEVMLNLLGPAKRWAMQSYPEMLSRPGWTMWIAESQGKPLGMTIFGPDPANPDLLQLDSLYTRVQSQRLGIGGRLLAEAARSNPSSDVILWCGEKNDKARRFYENKNFLIDGRTLDWEPLPGIRVPHVGYRLYRSARPG